MLASRLAFERLEDRTTPSATMVTALRLPAASLGAASSPAAFRGLVFYPAADSRGSELFKTDGTAAGTSAVAPVAANYLTVAGNTLFFITADATNGTRLWKTDGTTGGTVVVSTLLAHAAASFTGAPVVVGGALYINFTSAGGGAELWKSDGTAAGTGRVNAPASSAGWSNVYDPTAVNGKLLFFDTGGAAAWNLWRTDGTSPGTVKVGTLPVGVFPIWVAGAGGTLFVSTWSQLSGVQLWKSDGTTLTPVRQFTSDLWDLTAVGSKLFFRSYGPDGLEQVWSSDGTAAGTVPVASTSIMDAMPGSLPPLNGVGAGRTYFFAAEDATQGAELWRSDGTAAGTLLLKVFPGGFGGSPPQVVTQALVGGTLYFTASDGTHGVELWRSDGTAAGTVMVQDIDPGAAGSAPGHLLSANGTLYFEANDGSHGPALWKLAPSVTGSPVTGQEGQGISAVVATFSYADVTAAPAAFSATITWGDGHTSTGTVRAAVNGLFSVSGANAYAEAGGYSVGVKITLPGGVVLATSTTARVSDAPLSATATNGHANKGRTASFALGTLRDANALALATDFTVVINWGDGQASAGTLTPKGSGQFTIGGSHKYTAIGSIHVSVTITDRGGQAMTLRPVVLVTA